jgi:NADH:ubiquinone oxidoreductase subunit 3 (subunit A)
MPTPVSTESISSVIQLAVAPVFLLTGIGSVLNVLTARIGRVIDRSRAVEAEILAFDRCTTPEELTAARAELKVLDTRMASVQLAIGTCTLSILLVCLTIAILFIGEITPLRPAKLVAVMFIAAMCLLIAGLVMFLYEIRIALRSVRVKAALLKVE